MYRIYKLYHAKYRQNIINFLIEKKKHYRKGLDPKFFNLRENLSKIILFDIVVLDSDCQTARSLEVGAFITR